MTSLTRLGLLTVLSLVPIATVGCSSGEDGAQGDDQNVTRAAEADVGAACGGPSAIRCKAGLECKLEGKGAYASGKCDAPMVTCLAIAVCDQGDSEIPSCPNVDPSCYTRSICGTTVSCKKAGQVQAQARPIDGTWGAEQAILTIAAGKGSIEFDCGRATLETITFTSPTTFTATGTMRALTGIAPPPGLEPKPEPATFKGTVQGDALTDTMTLEMTVGDETTKLEFTLGRETQLRRCL